MGKRSRSSLESSSAEGLHSAALSSDSKRARQQHHSPKATLSLEGSLSEEVLLRILSFLDVRDLLAIARVSSAWHRLAQDGQVSLALTHRHL